MNLAEASAALGKKDAERAGLKEEKYKLQALKDSGHFGKLNLCAFQIDKGIADATYRFVYQCKNSDGSACGVETPATVLGDSVMFDLVQRPSIVTITCYFAVAPGNVVNKDTNSEFKEVDSNTAFQSETENEDDVNMDMGGFRGDVKEVVQAAAEHGGSAYFTCELPLVDLSSDGQQLRSELEGKLIGAHTLVEQASSPICHVKASMESVASSLASIEIQLEEVQKEFEELYSIVQQGAQNQKRGSSPQKSKKKTSVPADGENPATKASKSKPAGESMEDIAMKAAVGAAGTFMEHRAYLLFGVAAIGIYLYGDYASV